MATLIRDVLDSWWVIGGWAVVVVACSTVLLIDLRRNNREIAGLMRAVWILTVAYSGPLGLAVYWYSGRKQIARDSIWRRGWRSVSHCYSGCGAGEITGVLLVAGIMALGPWPVAASSFLLAYLFGYLLTAGPLIQEGVAVPTALWDAFTSETASILVMEVVAIGLDLWLAADATLTQPLFWGALVVSLSAGLLAAWPVNLLLIRLGVKEGMHDPRMHA